MRHGQGISAGKLVAGLLALQLGLVMAGCAAKPTFTPQAYYKGERLVRSVYVYSFLDLREQEIGPKFMREFKRQLTAQLDAAGIGNQQLWFNDSPVRAEFSKIHTPAETTYGYQQTITRSVIKDVPIAKVIETNQAQERAFGSTHRMVLFPENTSTGVNTGYKLRWDIIDTRTGKIEWTTRSSSENFNWWSNDDAPVERARVLVEGIITEMRGSGVLHELPVKTAVNLTDTASSKGGMVPAPPPPPVPLQSAVENKVAPSAWISAPEQTLSIRSFQKSELGTKAAAETALANIGANNNPQGRPETRIQILSTFIDVVQIPAGRYTMGSSLAPNESPAHPVEIRKPFWIGKFPVTQRQWLAVMKFNPSKHKGVGEDAPVERVSMNACQAFIERLNQAQETWRFRLPSEAEWEYACRAGTTGDAYGGIDTIAWQKSNAGGTTHVVGQKQPNAYGLYDMLGNVWQWCLDLQHDNYNNAPTDDTPWVTGSYYSPWGVPLPQGNLRFENVHVTRGGSWLEEASSLRSSRRQMRHNSKQDPDLGFRIVCVPR